ncbi:hypothetical protein FRB93_000869 [Tulasnella sp. JGI-2019a]|nr:hypothetical protein FRB93_000869 [Tulasnella sp. JGI-2019a]
MVTITQLIGGVFLAWLIRQLFLFRQLIKAYQDVPNFCVVFSPYMPWNYFPPFRTLKVPGIFHPMRSLTDNYAMYERFQSDVFLVIHMIPLGARIYVADIHAIKDITTARNTFHKPVKMYQSISMYGNNMVASEGSEWSRYRKACASSFSDRNLQLVWDSAARIMQEIFTSWSGRPEIRIPISKDWTLKVALHVLSAAGFGIPISWAETDKSAPADRNQSFHAALSRTMDQFLWRFILPIFVWGSEADREAVAVAGLVGKGWLGAKPKQALQTFSELNGYMHEMIDERRALGITDNEKDLLSNLIRASDADDGEGAPLSFREVTGNMFVFMIAGHETSGHTLAFMFALLALDLEEQQRLYDHIKSVLGDKEPTYNDFNSLSRVLAALHETLRLYPPVINIPKECMSDATVTIRATGGEKIEATRTIAIVRGTMISINTTGVSYNRKSINATAAGYTKVLFAHPVFICSAILERSRDVQS